VIVRVFTARLRHGAEPEFLAARRAPIEKEWDGLVSRMVAVRMKADRAHAVSISVWRDWGAVQAFAGEMPDHPVLAADELQLLEEWSINHYEVILREELPAAASAPMPAGGPF
jgi:hypothetical protein